MQTPPQPARNDPREIRAWCMYDWANSVYSLVIATAVFPIYYGAVAPDVVEVAGHSLMKESLRPFSIAFAYSLIVVLGPLLAGVADARGAKKSFLMLFCYLGAAACISLAGFTTETLWLGLGSFVLASFSFAMSDNFYNAYLTDVATPDQFDRVSARGYTMGYLGSAILLIIVLAVITFSGALGITEGTATRLGFVLTGLWWGGFGTWVFTRLRARKPASDDRRSLRAASADGFRELARAFRTAVRTPVIGKFLLTFLCFNAGVQTVLNVAADYGAGELGLPAAGLITTILLIQFVAMGGAFAFGRLSEKKGNIFALKLAIAIWALVCVAAYFTENAMQFYALGAAVGLVMGGVQSVARAAYAKLLPPVEGGNAALFSFYSALDKVAVIIGTFTFGLAVQLTGEMRNAILFLIAYFVLGFVLLSIFRWKSARPDVIPGADLE